MYCSTSGYNHCRLCYITLSLRRNAPWKVAFFLGGGGKSVDRWTLWCISFRLSRFMHLPWFNSRQRKMSSLSKLKAAGQLAGHLKNWLSSCSKKDGFFFTTFFFECRPWPFNRSPFTYCRSPFHSSFYIFFPLTKFSRATVKEKIELWLALILIFCYQ